ncbi:MAG: tol-pal system protein [Paracoccus sp. (in: a-proteobacteria)]|nr:tol-pal system protein [Paracoccus sp. (in: a-proteobacteria)]
MRAFMLAALLAAPGLAGHAQDGAGIVIDDPSLAGGLEATMPDADIYAVPASLDGASLADMQAALRAISADLQALRAELLASGAAGFAAAGGDGAIDRMNAMEAQIAHLTDRTELLANQIRRIVADGTNRIGDIEFRLCEMDPHCDLGALMTAELGRFGTGALPGGPAPGSAPPASDISAMPLPPLESTAAPQAPPTEEEAREFALAQAAVAAGNWAQAIEELDHLASAHAGGPLTADVLYLRGTALLADAQPQAAAESWLMAFSAAPDGPRAPASLLALARSMAALGAAGDGCPYLAELTRRFPDAPETAEAAPALAACPEGEGAD